MEFLTKIFGESENEDILGGKKIVVEHLIVVPTSSLANIILLFLAILILIKIGKKF